MAVYRLKNGKWRAEPYVGRKLKSKVFSTEAEALAYEFDAVAEAHGHEWDVKDIPLEFFTVEHLIDYWSEVRRQDIELQCFSQDTFDRMTEIFSSVRGFSSVARKVVQDLDPDDIDRLINYWWSLPTAKSKKRKSFAKDLDYFKTLLNFYKERKRDHRFHLPILKSHRRKCIPADYEPPRPVAISAEDVGSWLESLKEVAPDPVYYHLGLLLLHTGMRRGEALGLEARHIDWKRNVLKVSQQVVYSHSTGKGELVQKLKTDSSKREIQFGKSLAMVLKYLVTKRPSGLLLGLEGREFLPKSTITHVFNRAFDKSDLGLSGTHVCRRTFVTLGTNATSIEAVQRAVGHRNRVTTESYFDLSSQDGINVSQGVEDVAGVDFAENFAK